MSITLFQVPKKFKKPLEGVRVFTWNNEELLIAWYNNIVLIASTDDCKICSVLNINGAVHNVFQCCTSLLCLDQYGCVYVLKYVKNEDDVDIFNSSADDDDGFDDRCQPLQKSFVPSLVIPNIICVNSISTGFLAVKNECCKLYLEFYSLTSNLGTIQKLHCNELCNVSKISSDDCILEVFKSDRFTLDLCNHLVKSSCRQHVDVIFIGLPSGNLYCVTVDASNCTILGKPSLIYSSCHLISGILCVTNKQNQLYSKICVFLDYGIIVVISVSFSKCLRFDVIHLTSNPQTIVGIGDSFIFGDGQDLWFCAFEENTLAIDIKKLPIKGVHFIEKLPSKNKVLVVTFHSIFYVFSLNQITEYTQSLTTSYANISNITESLHQLLGKTEFYKEEIMHENSIITAFSIASRQSICKQLFSHKISVQCIDDISLQNCFGDCSYNFEEVLIGCKSPVSFYCIGISLTNESDIEFLSNFWSIVISVTADNVTTQKVEKITQNLTYKSNIFMSISKYIEKTYLGVSLSVIIVRELPATENKEKGVAWLTIPIIDTVLDADHFLTKGNLKNMSDKFFHLHNLGPWELDSLKSKLWDNHCGNQECVYEFKLKLNSDLVNVWSTIVNSFNAQNDKDKDHNLGSNKLCAYAGTDRVEFVLIDKGIRIISQNPHFLFAMKSIIVNKWLTVSDSFSEVCFPATIVSQSSLYKDKVKVENVTKNKLSFSQFKEAWRNFISTNLTF